MIGITKMGRGARQLVFFGICKRHGNIILSPETTGFRKGVLHILLVCNMKGRGWGQGIYKRNRG
jgi:hypothetical protein